MEDRNISGKVRKFYEGCSFPGYDDFDSLASLMIKSKKSVYARLLDEQIPFGVRILDVGCGTGQLPLFLGISNRLSFGMDFSFASLKKGKDFRDVNNLHNVFYTQGNLFSIPFKAESFHFVFCNGVLHHTGDPYGGFQSCNRVLMKGGYIIIGLYNKFGRFFNRLRSKVFNVTRNKFLKLDYYFRHFGSDSKRWVWFQDQYKHPHESSHTVDEVLTWFSLNNIEYINAIPKIKIGDSFRSDEKLFKQSSPGNSLEHLIKQLGWVLSMSKEGGFYILIGRKR